MGGSKSFSRYSGSGGWPPLRMGCCVGKRLRGSSTFNYDGEPGHGSSAAKIPATTANPSCARRSTLTIEALEIADHEHPEIAAGG